MADKKTKTQSKSGDKKRAQVELEIKASVEKSDSKGEVVLNITIPQNLTQKIYQETLKHLAKDVEIKGFRKGQAPLSLVEEKLGAAFIWRQASQSILTIAYLQAVQKTKISPISDPKLIKAVTDPKSDWRVTFKVPVVPDIKLPDDYLYQIAKKVKNQPKIITPDQAKQEAGPESEKDINKKLSEIFKALLEIGQVELSEALLESEVNRRLASIFDQLQKVAMTIDDYAKSRGLSPQQLRDQIKHQAEEELKLEFLLAEIAKREKIKAKETEVDKVISQTGKKNSATQQDKIYVRSILEKQKVINFLLESVDKQKVVIVP